jgi:hypothetical protein
MKKCSKCKLEKSEENFWKRNNRSSGVNSECKECCSKRRKKYYQSNREKLCKYVVEGQKGNKRYRAYQNKYAIQKRREYDKKFIARQICSLAARAGMIVRPEICSKCSKPGKIEGHHEDYNKPLDVIWVCKGCHELIHHKGFHGN